MQPIPILPERRKLRRQQLLRQQLQLDNNHDSSIISSSSNRWKLILPVSLPMALAGRTAWSGRDSRGNGRMGQQLRLGRNQQQHRKHRQHQQRRQPLGEVQRRQLPPRLPRLPLRRLERISPTPSKGDPVSRSSSSNKSSSGGKRSPRTGAATRMRRLPPFRGRVVQRAAALALMLGSMLPHRASRKRLGRRSSSTR